MQEALVILMAKIGISSQCGKNGLIRYSPKTSPKTKKIVIAVFHINFLFKTAQYLSALSKI